MEVLKTAMAGTLESSDVLVTVEPVGQGIEVSIESIVMNQYGRQIKAVILDTLSRLNVENVRLTAIDKGALECTLKARVEAAIFRSCDSSQSQIPWGGDVR